MSVIPDLPGDPVLRIPTRSVGLKVTLADYAIRIPSGMSWLTSGLLVVAAYIRLSFPGSQPISFSVRDLTRLESHEQVL